MNNPLRFPDDEAFRCLRGNDPEGFHRNIEGRKSVDLSDCDLRGVDFRSIDLSKVILKGAYLRDADLRGQDLRHMDLEGCTLRHAKISGVYFPDNIEVNEILFSQQHGTRLRTRKG